MKRGEWLVRNPVIAGMRGVTLRGEALGRGGEESIHHFTGA